jgi:hypothetical protein
MPVAVVLLKNKRIVITPKNVIFSLWRVHTTLDIVLQSAVHKSPIQMGLLLPLLPAVLFSQ